VGQGSFAGLSINTLVIDKKAEKTRTNLTTPVGQAKLSLSHYRYRAG
jgi:hypothetical protein